MSCGVGSRCGSDPCVAVAVASAYSSNLTPSLGASIGHGSSPRNGKKTKKVICYFSSLFRLRLLNIDLEVTNSSLYGIQGLSQNRGVYFGKGSRRL